MACYIGIDIGAVSATAALLVRGQLAGSPADWQDLHRVDAAPHVEGDLYISEYRRTRGKPIATARSLLEQIIAAVGVDEVASICLTGSGAKATAATLDATSINEFKAVAGGLAAMGVKARTVFEMGGESSKYLLLAHNADGSYGIVDYATNGDCAAGTGSFIDQQAGRLKYAVEDIGDIVLQADRAAQIAGRCSVFAKSDMIHAQQKGYTPPEVLRGLCNAVARNFRTAVVRSHPVEPPVAFIGGVTANQAVVRAMRETFGLDESELFIPEVHGHLPAIGAALEAAHSDNAAALDQMGDLRAASDSANDGFPRNAPLNMSNVVLLRDHVEASSHPGETDKIEAYLGVDIGSVSTNLVLIDTDGKVIHEIYTRTQGRPIDAVSEGLKSIHKHFGSRLKVHGVGTTGSGRELIGKLIGADTINDEITAHKTGAMFVGKTILDGRIPDTIFEIGGQDAKYISLQDGVVVDFTMNDACAAGTGSFLEERAEELDISIKGQFADLALSSQAPIRMGERCTVFMERDVNSYMQRGAAKADLVAGLAYSVVHNYINRVVRGRTIGETIFFQGGTAYNDAVAAAFAAVTGKEIIVPPFNGVVGAIGSALLARDKMSAQPAGEGKYVSEASDATAKQPLAKTSFRGYDLSKVNYTLREFTCKACSNACQIQQFTVEGEKTYWGDKCSDRYRQVAAAQQKPVIEDLFAYRQKLLLDDSHLPSVPQGAATVGIPMTMFAMEQLPFWRTMLATCGFNTVLSEPTTKQTAQAGLDTAVAEPCFPIIVAHGHVMNLIGRDDVDHILLPNIISLQTKWMHTESHLCPWHQTLPFVIRQAPDIIPHAGKLLSPQMHFRDGQTAVTRHLQKFFKPLGVSRSTVTKAVRAGYEAQAAFAASLIDKGHEAMATLERTGAKAIILVGRPYNVHDAGMNLSAAQKLRDFYGVNCIPLDCLDTEPVDIRNVNPNMFWSLGRKILAASKLIAAKPNLHIINITNFKCGPDSFITHFIRRASGKPFLTLQFDGHSNDAGMMTRCEAYLDSIGVLRPWRLEQTAQTAISSAK